MDADDVLERYDVYRETPKNPDVKGFRTRTVDGFSCDMFFKQRHLSSDSAAFLLNVKMKWSEAITLEFVKIYLKHETLWNPGDPSYKLKHVRQRAYTDIINEFKASTSKNLTVPEVKNKIKNLRSTYMQEVHKILRKSTPNFIYEPSLVWFQEMDNYLKNLPSSHIVSHKEPQESREVDSSCQMWVDTESTNIEEPHPDPLHSQSDEEIEETLKPEPESTTIVKKEKLHSSISPYKLKKKKKKHRISTTESCNGSMSDGLKEDEFDIYGKYIASQLRKMNLSKALRLQIQIHNLVTEARICDLSCD